LDAVNSLMGKLTGWVDKLFEFFGLYTTKYSKYIVYAVLIVALSKIFKIKLNLGGGGGKK
jgi:hypothetical protein